MSFEARYAGRCGVCDERIRVGDLVTYVDDEIAPRHLPATRRPCWSRAAGASWSRRPMGPVGVTPDAHHRPGPPRPDLPRAPTPRRDPRLRAMGRSRDLRLPQRRLRRPEPAPDHPATHRPCVRPRRPHTRRRQAAVHPRPAARRAAPHPLRPARQGVPHLRAPGARTATGRPRVRVRRCCPWGPLEPGTRVHPRRHRPGAAHLAAESIEHHPTRGVPA